jgi:hypothetical protein
VQETHADASAGLLGAALDAILAQCLAEPFEPWPGSLVAALVEGHNPPLTHEVRF